MHIDWFIVLMLTVAFVFGGYSLWLTGKENDEKPSAQREEADRSASH